VTTRGQSHGGRTSAGTGGRPVLSSNFLVDFGDGKSREAGGGFSEIIFPEFRLGPGASGLPAAPSGTGPNPVDAASHLILKRGVCGALDLYTWWDQTRNGQVSPQRKITVQLLGSDLQTVVLTWTFHQVRPVALSYSPLRAQENEVVIETLELAFDRFELS
jgi:hypothetical protein